MRRGAAAHHALPERRHDHRRPVLRLPREPGGDGGEPGDHRARGRRAADDRGDAVALRRGAARGRAPPGELVRVGLGDVGPHRQGRRPPAPDLLPAEPGHGVPARRRARHRQPVHAGAAPRAPHGLGRAGAPVHAGAVRGHRARDPALRRLGDRESGVDGRQPRGVRRRGHAPVADLAVERAGRRGAPVRGLRPGQGGAEFGRAEAVSARRTRSPSCATTAWTCSSSSPTRWTSRSPTRAAACSRIWRSRSRTRAR